MVTALRTLRFGDCQVRFVNYKDFLEASYPLKKVEMDPYLKAFTEGARFIQYFFKNREALNEFSRIVKPQLHLAGTELTDLSPAQAIQLGLEITNNLLGYDENHAPEPGPVLNTDPERVTNPLFDMDFIKKGKGTCRHYVSLYNILWNEIFKPVNPRLVNFFATYTAYVEMKHVFVTLTCLQSEKEALATFVDPIGQFDPLCSDNFSGHSGLIVHQNNLAVPLTSIFLAGSMVSNIYEMVALNLKKMGEVSRIVEMINDYASIDLNSS